MFRPDDDIGYAGEHGAVARGAGKADLASVDQRDGADRILEGAAVDFVRALTAPITCFQQIRGRLKIDKREIETDFETGHCIHARLRTC